ncbi:transcription factor bHLH18 isoform X2 [Beta vulgaris subsp. vulgaris]|uniref:transcription factor bHLH18 isoform X2 n=1 Tax=Beta vulgaris subsp. vulgaris TaxID=3555 RepID=UPI002036A485|nr:transcription factor bHLH18 isoform X2 [Beta vulgaris subsp. vulgaris]
MEAWLAELDMEVDPAIPTIICNPYHQNHQSETMDVLFDEQLTTTLDEHFPYISTESNTDISPPLDFDWNFIEEFMSPRIISNYDDNDNNNSNNHNDNIVSLDVQEKRKLKNKEETKKQEINGGTKRKRQPTQVQDHIIAERKRREILGQMFISLSTIVPGLKKMDKTTVLGEAIKYMKQLQETVKTLEELAAKKIVESIVVVKKSKLMVNDNEGGNDNASSSTVDDNCAIDMCGSSAKDGSRYEAKNLNDLKPEIETKISGQTLLIRVSCEQHKGILAKLITEVENHDMRVTNCSAVPFESLGLDITIVTQIEKGFTKNVKECIRRLHSSLQLASR